jgi:hypothetical protein
MLELVCGWDPREVIGFQVAQFSAIRRTSEPLRFIPLIETALRRRGLYRRPHEQRNGQLWCPISNAPMSTTFACSRFLTPWLVDSDWVLFCDFADMLFLADPAELFALSDDRFAVMVVKRLQVPVEDTKMDGQAQTIYQRKNWSSVCLWNRRHPANAKLTLEMVNTLPGRDLHRFCWLEDAEIGDLPLEWNYLAGIDGDIATRPNLLHYTLGLPTMAGYERGPWADVWLRELGIIDTTRGALKI